jgi:hypothetical protein
MPVKFKESVKVLVDRKSNRVKTVNYFMRSTKLEDVVAAYESTHTTPKRKQKLRNELVRRNAL